MRQNGTCAGTRIVLAVVFGTAASITSVVALPAPGVRSATTVRAAPGGIPRHAGPHRPRGYGGVAFAGAGLGAAYGAGASGSTYVDASVRTYPSPSELAPAAWSYGTYGIPTVPGIAAPPSAAPVVYVIDDGRRPARAGGSRVVSRGSDDRWVAVDPNPTAGGARVVTVTVPRR